MLYNNNFLADTVIIMNESSIFTAHNHLSCIEKAMADAKAICRSKKARLTTLRELVLELIWQNHEPLGAYQLMDMLRERYEGNVAPPTVYRALDFLQEYGLVHRLASLNAYIGCSQLQQRDHQPSFFICKECNNAMEVNTPRVSQAIREIASARQFSASKGGAVEVIGVCNSCSRNGRASQQKDSLSV